MDRETYHISSEHIQLGSVHFYSMILELAHSGYVLAEEAKVHDLILGDLERSS